uniref:Uncharacterized protein n=1 Tax=Salmonella phage PMBT27 TaxID=3137285 RepID=A0AAU8BWG8_9VIRU
MTCGIGFIQKLNSGFGGSNDNVHSMKVTHIINQNMKNHNSLVSSI